MSLNKLFLEHKNEKIVSNKQFAWRLIKYITFSFVLIIFSLGLGTIGYMFYGNMEWIDAFYMSSMILTGMGPIVEMKNDAAKIFSACYALYSGVAFLSISAVFFTPIIHRLLHILHVNTDEN